MKQSNKSGGSNRNCHSGFKRLHGRFGISRGNGINNALHYCINYLAHCAIEERDLINSDSCCWRILAIRLLRGFNLQRYEMMFDLSAFWMQTHDKYICVYLASIFKNLFRKKPFHEVIWCLQFDLHDIRNLHAHSKIYRAIKIFFFSLPLGFRLRQEIQSVHFIHVVAATCPFKSEVKLVNMRRLSKKSEL